MNKKELNNAFYDACKDGDLDKVKYFLTSPELKKHADIHANNDYGFRWACLDGHLDVVKYLLTSPELEEHADIHAEDDLGFRWACRDGHLDIVKYLLTSPELEEYADVHAYDDGLRLACNEGHFDIVKYLLTSPELEDHADIHADDDCGFRWACRRGHDMIIDFIVRHENYLSDRLTLCLEELGEQEFFETLSTLSQEQQDYFYENHKEFFDEHLDELFPLYLQNNTQLPDGLCKEKQEEIDIMI